MQAGNKSGLAIIFTNPQPEREAQYPDGWILLTGNRQFNILVCRDGRRHPYVVQKEAA
jgi:hypothetical protein